MEEGDLSPYRDKVDALRARLAEVERVLAEKRAQVSAPARETKWRVAAFIVTGMALVVLGSGLRGLYRQHLELLGYQAQVTRAPQPAAAVRPQRWRAHVFTTDVARLADGAECSVAIDAPCNCRDLVRRRARHLRRRRLRRPRRPDLDGSPECEIDARAPGAPCASWRPIPRAVIAAAARRALVRE